MAEAYPRSPRSLFLKWCASHQATWEANATALSLTAPVTAAYKTAVTAATDAEQAAEDARNNAKALTEKANQTAKTLQVQTSNIVRAIKQKAITTGDPNIYVLGQIPAPTAPGTALPPAKPTDLAIGITPTGALVLTWKASNPTGTQGTSYVIYRKVVGQTSFSFCGVSGKKTFTDNTFTAGPDSVQYIVQGQRSDSTGLPSDILTVNFGRTGTGAGEGNFSFTTSSDKMAA